MMQGCTEPSSTLHPFAFAIAAHNMTDPMGANANATMTRSASQYHSHGNLLCGLPFITAIPTVIGGKVSAFSHELLNLAYDTIEFVDEI